MIHCGVCCIAEAEAAERSMGGHDYRKGDRLEIFRLYFVLSRLLRLATTELPLREGALTYLLPKLAIHFQRHNHSDLRLLPT